MKLTVEGLEKERDFYFGEMQKLNPTNLTNYSNCRKVEGCGGYVPGE